MATFPNILSLCWLCTRTHLCCNRNSANSLSVLSSNQENIFSFSRGQKRTLSAESSLGIPVTSVFRHDGTKRAPSCLILVVFKRQIYKHTPNIYKITQENFEMISRERIYESGLKYMYRIAMKTGDDKRCS